MSHILMSKRTLAIMPFVSMFYTMVASKVNVCISATSLKLGLFVILLWPIDALANETIAGVPLSLMSQVFPSVPVDATPIYKQIDGFELSIVIRKGKSLTSGESSAPALVFFFGGGWKKGNYTHYERQAQYFSELGFVTALVNYRVKKYHGATPRQALEDAKSALRFLRKNAAEYGINPNEIIGAGGSAGAHLVAAASVITGFNTPSDDITISSVPNALILWNPVIDNGPGGYGHNRVIDYWQAFSPFHNIKDQHPPTLVMLGSKDRLLSVQRGQAYIDKIKGTGAKAIYKVYEKQSHGFGNGAKYVQTLLQAHQFLYDLGYTKIAIPKISDGDTRRLNSYAKSQFHYE